MPIVFSPSFVISDPRFTRDHPIVGFRNIVTLDNLVATVEDPLYPVSNLVNPATHLHWRGGGDSSPVTSTQYLTVTTGSADPIDYVGIAKHNFGSGAFTISIEGDQGAGWVTLAGPIIPGSDAPLLFRFTLASFTGIRVKIVAGTDEPRAAVLFIGKLLILPHTIWQEHTPITLGRRQEVVNGKSQSGNYLGSILLGAWKESGLKSMFLDPDYYRQYLDEWIEAAVYDRQTFFFSWRPQSYPTEVGYCWSTNDVQPKNAAGHGRMEFEIKFEGVV